MSIKEEPDPSANPSAQASSRGEFPTEAPKGYEQMLQKLEEEVRGHIRVEQQLKLHIDNLQSKMEDDEKAAKESQDSLKDKAKQCENLDKKVKELTQKCKQLEHRIETTERVSCPLTMGPDSFLTQTNISAEEKLGKFHTDFSQLKRIGDLAQRVSLFDLLFQKCSKK